MKRLILFVWFALTPILVIAQAPPPPSLVYPANGAQWVELKPNLSFVWHSSPGAIWYEFQMCRNQDFLLEFGKSVVVNSQDTSLGIFVENPGGVWYWRVKAASVGGNWGDWSEVWSFTAPPLAPFSLNAPSGEGVSRNPVIKWCYINAASGYRLRVSANSDFSSSVVDVTINEARTSYISLADCDERSYPVSGLDTNTVYFVRIDPLYEGGTGYRGSYWFIVGHVTPTASLVSPANGSSSFQSPLLVWKKENASIADIQISANSNFSSFEVSRTLSENSYQTNLPVGTHYWRVRPYLPIVGYGEWTEAWSFTIAPLTSIPDIPTLSSPANGFSSTTSPSLSWNSAANAASYNLQVATDVNFVNLVLNQAGLTSLSYQTSGLSPNTYYWRVSATNVSGTSSWSNVRSFTVVSLPIPDRPILVSPPDGFPGPQGSPLLIWRRSAGAETYNLQIIVDATFWSSPVVNLTGISDTTYQTNFSSGSYRWRVSATNAGGTSLWSDTPWFFITPLPSSAPQLVQPLDNSSNSSNPIILEWRRLVSISTYELQVANDNGFVGMLVDTSFVDIHIYQTNLPPGTYYWRVRGANLAGTGPWSPIWKFTVTLPVLPDVPALSSPVHGFSSTSSPLLMWNASLYAEKYNLEVAMDVGFTSVVVYGTNLGLSYQTNLPPGTYYWRVRGVNANGVSNFSLPWGFIINPSVVPTANLVSPANGSSSFQGPLLVWSKKDATMVSLQVAKDASFGNLVIHETGLTGLSYQTNLSVGSYYWRVQPAGTTAGSWTEAWSFKVVVQTPSAPTLVVPLDNASNQPLDVTLQWNPSERATSYWLEVSVYPDFSLPVFKSSALTVTSQRTGLVNDTKYYWRVAANNQSGTSQWATRSFRTRQALAVANPFSIPTLTDLAPVFSNSLSDPPLFSGNAGTLSYTASSSSLHICSASISGTDTLVVTFTGIGMSGNAAVTITATDTDGATAYYTTPVFQLITDVEDFGEIPQKFSLSQNYPNPFNPATSIKYTVASSKYVTLTVYDILGKEVATLVDEEKFPGSYEVSFNASNLPSGVYFYRINAGAFVETKKMLLQK